LKRALQSVVCATYCSLNIFYLQKVDEVVGGTGFEPVTSSMSTTRSTN
jgi:hypothetical protein